MAARKRKLLIVDDNKNILTALTRLLEMEVDEVHTASNPNLIPDLVRANEYDAIFLDMNFSASVQSGNEGLFWMKEILKIDPNAVIIPITAYGDVDLAVRAVKEGAADFVVKPWDNDKLLATLNSAYKLRQSKLEVESLKDKQKSLVENIDKKYSCIIGSSLVMQEIHDTIKKVAATDVDILILGENGTGKELVAREIQRQSIRNQEILISVDMGSLSESLFESEMFGYEKGAFTDAKEIRKGRFEIASEGTIFLDEIGNLSLSMQAKLLSALQNRTFTRIGANTPIEFDTRLICATNKNLKEMISEGLFREDLFFRINTIEITIPPLRDRGDDILELSEFFLDTYKAKYGKDSLQLTKDASKFLLNYHWPGNVRELQHTIEKAVILCDTNMLMPADLYLPKHELKSSEDMPVTLDEIEKLGILKALERNKGNVFKTAKELNIARQTLYNKIQKHKL
ncbi:MAG: sigma-54 dependent transcriptional regulator [Bacteroidales bacterium]|jgi:DNA-binding NtrC family response regulator|nr:sigma-54 dependent transcriptional regulator [Bacteroidales bacterium]